MIKEAEKRVRLKYFDLSCKSNNWFGQYVVKGFAIGPLWVVPLLSAISHIFIDIRFIPYGFAYYPTNVKLLLSVIYGIVMGGGFYLAIRCIQKNRPIWELWKEIVWLISTVFLITTTNYLIRLGLFRYVFDIESLFPVTYWRYLLIGAEVAGVTALTFEFIQFVLVESGMITFPMRVDENQTDTQIIIYGYGKDDELKLDIDKFVFAESKGNYVYVTTKDPNIFQLKTTSMRLSLQEFQKQMVSMNNIERVHKSFVVNMNLYHELLGNSRKATLIFENEVEIPVSRVFFQDHQANK